MFEIFAKGGFLVPIILFLSVIALCLIIERLLFFRKTQKELNEGIKTALSAIKILEEKNNNKAVAIKIFENAKESSVKRVFLKALSLDSNDIEKQKIVLSNAINLEERFFSKFIQALATIGNISPILGLLGTVIGMIKAFMVIQEMGGKVNAVVLAGGIWEAMLTTALGLAVALPTIAFHSYFTAKIEENIAKLEDISVLFLRKEGSRNV